MLETLRLERDEPAGREAGDAAASEQALVERALADPAAFEALYARYVDRVYWYCFRRLANREAAEDATSLTFAKALAALSTCRKDLFRPWLFRIARNVVSDAYRARHGEAPVEAAHWTPDPAPGPDALALTQEAQRAVAALLARLSEGQRAVVELRLAGLSGSEIAAALGRTQIWVRVTQLRAYSRLRQILEAEPHLLPSYITHRKEAGHAPRRP